MKYIIFVLLLAIPSSTLGQESSGSIKMITEFYTELFNDNVAPEEIASTYAQYLNESEYKQAVGMIKSFRKLAVEETGHFSFLKNDIKEKKFSISAYNSFDDSDKVKFTKIAEEKRNNIYKVTLKSTIPQYVLLDNNKIVSFFGFQKGSYDEYYFIAFK